MLKTIKNILNSQLYALSLYARQIAGTVVLLLIARYLSVYDYGLFSSYKNIAGFFFLFANLGFADYILVSSKANVNEVKQKIALFMSNAITIALSIAICSMFFYLESHILFVLVVVRTFLDGTFFSLILPYFQATKKFNTIAVINIIYSIGIIFIAIISYILKLSLIKFLLLNIILGVINFIQCSFYTKINYLLVVSNIKHFIKKLDKSIFNYCLVEVAILFYIQIQSLFVSIYAKKEDAALYFAAFTIGSIIQLLVGAQKQKLIPEFIKSKTANVKKVLLNNISNISTLITMILLFFIFLGKNVLVLFYGKEYYANAYLILILFTISSYFSAIIVITGTYLTAIGKVYKKTPMQMEAIIIAILSLLILRKEGIYGATWSYLLTSLYLAFRYIITVNKEINSNTISNKGEQS